MGTVKENYKKLDIALLICLIILATTLNSNALIFHITLEIISVVVAIIFGVIVLNTMERMRDQRMVILGLAYLFVGILDLFHVMTFPGLGLLSMNTENLTLHFRFMARLLESISILIALKWGSVVFRYKRLVGFFSIFVFAVIGSGLFSSELSGLYYSEAGLMGVSLYLNFFIISALVYCFVLSKKIYKKSGEYTYHYIYWAVIYTLLANVSLALQTDFGSLYIVMAHVFKVISFYMIYKGVIVAAIKDPYDLMNKERMRFFMMFEKNKNAILLIENGDLCSSDILFANEEACKMFKYPKEEIESYSLNTLLAEECLSNKYLFENESNTIFETTLVTKDQIKIQADFNV